MIGWTDTAKKTKNITGCAGRNFREVVCCLLTMVFTVTGCQQTTSIDELVVDWPSGDQQVFRGIQADQRLLILENQDEPFTLFAK